MNNRSLRLIVFLSISALSAPFFLCAERILVDEVRVIIHGRERKALITTSSLRPKLDGSPCSLRDAVIEELMLFDAEMMHIQSTTEQAEQTISQLQKERGLTRKMIKRMFAEQGRTYEEGVEQLRRKQTCETYLEYKVKSHKELFVTKEDVESWYAEHPDYLEATYTLKQGFIESPEERDEKELLNALTSGAFDGTIEWDEPFTVQESDLAPEKRDTIMSTSVGGIIEIERVEDGYEITQLAAVTPKQIIPLQERYNELYAQLRQERYEKVLLDLFDELLAHAHMTFIYEADRNAVFTRGL